MNDQISRLRQLRVLLISVIYAVLFAGVCALLLEWSTTWGAAGWNDHWYSPFTRGSGFYLEIAALTIVIYLLMAITGRLWLSLGVMLSLTLVVAGANVAKLRVRSEPLYPSDLDFLSTPRFVLAMASPTTWLLAVLLVLAVLVAFIWIGHRLEPAFPRVRRSTAPRRWTALLVVRAVVALACVVALVQATRFNEPGNAWRGVYESKDVAWKFWYQRLNYRANGFVGGFLYNMPSVAMKAPEGYSEATMRALTARWRAAAAETNRGRDAARLDDANVVVILSEAFSDPTQLKGLELDEDPIPRTRATMSGTSSGTMLAQLYGGGTANMEFEALTGQSLALLSPQTNTPYQQFVADQDGFPSAVGLFKGTGHRAIAIHPYFTGMYQRKKVYENLGFDEFIHDTTMQSDAKIENGDFISDESAFDEVLHQIRTIDQPAFINLVTMQNHVPVAGSYAHPLPVDGVSDEQADSAGQYARGLTYTDESLDRMLAALEETDEPTYVVFYGDHQPGIYGDEIVEKNPGIGMYRTPYFIWSNQGTVPAAEPLTSPTMFLPMLFEMAGARIPPYYALLEAVRAEVPAMEQGKYFDPTGREYTATTLTPRARELLHDMALVQYDFSIGQRYAADEMFYPLSR
ncbi:LTA synthase family protein [Nocardioides sp. LHG3406-4]|uniref:LTA synthase family protein n=1 Tax=Nocardioides sp. LHG3406-4 TaxID=2804575 RepID=UPI003CFA5FCE